MYPHTTSVNPKKKQRLQDVSQGRSLREQIQHFFFLSLPSYLSTVIRSSSVKSSLVWTEGLTRDCISTWTLDRVVVEFTGSIVLVHVVYDVECVLFCLYWTEKRGCPLVVPAPLSSAWSRHPVDPPSAYFHRICPSLTLWMTTSPRSLHDWW